MLGGDLNNGRDIVMSFLMVWLEGKEVAWMGLYLDFERYLSPYIFWYILRVCCRLCSIVHGVHGSLHSLVASDADSERSLLEPILLTEAVRLSR